MQERNRMKNLVGFIVGDVRYAVDILKVREIINPLPLVALPHAPKTIIGVADHRGEVVPVIDLHERFGLPPAPASQRMKWIIIAVSTEDGTRAVGLSVDAITDVFGGGQAEERDVPMLGTGDTERGVMAVLARDEGLTFVIDVDVLGAAAKDVDVAQLVAGAP